MEKEHNKNINNNKNTKEQKPFFHYDLTEKVSPVNKEEEIIELLDEITKVDEF
ncbi:MAG: hypothetical protein ACOY46_18410 [Bacillota bacterium]